MCKFPGTYKVVLGRAAGLEGTELDIVEEPTGYKLTLKTTPNEVWTFQQTCTSCSLTGGTRTGTKDVLNLEGSCTQDPRATRFKYILGILVDPNGPPDDQIVEWVAEDQG